MNSLASHPHPDDIARLLRDDHDAPADIAEHLAGCAECRDTLERQAMGESGWLLDAASARQLGLKPTGHAARDEVRTVIGDILVEAARQG